MRKPTIYEALKEKLGRNPTAAELKTDVERIKTDGYVMAAERGKLRHQRRTPAKGRKRGSLGSMISTLAAPNAFRPSDAPAKPVRPRMGYLKLTRDGLMSNWFARATEYRNKFSLSQKMAPSGQVPMGIAREFWDTMNFSPDGMVTTGPANAEVFLKWARSVDGWKETYVVWEPTGEAKI